jgi:hypothetical protein
VDHIKNFRNCAVKMLRRFFANFCHEIGCENDQTYIFRFVKYLSTFFYTYLPVNIHFQLIIITNVSILTDPAYFVPPSWHCGILALRSRDFWEITLKENTCSVCLRFTGGFARRFFIWNKIFSQPRVKYFTNINKKCYFLPWLFQLRWTLIQHFQVFQVNKPNTCFAFKVISQVTCKFDIPNTHINDPSGTSIKIFKKWNKFQKSSIVDKMSFKWS